MKKFSENSKVKDYMILVIKMIMLQIYFVFVSCDWRDDETEALVHHVKIHDVMLEIKIEKKRNMWKLETNLKRIQMMLPQSTNKLGRYDFKETIVRLTHIKIPFTLKYLPNTSIKLCLN